MAVWEGWLERITSRKGDESLIIVMRQGASAEDVAHVVERLEAIGAEAHVSEGRLRTVIGAVGDREEIQQLPWEAFPGVERAVPVLKPFKFVSRDFQPEDTVAEVGGEKVLAGPYDRLVAMRLARFTRFKDGAWVEPEAKLAEKVRKDALDFMINEARWILDAKAAGKPVLGICIGCQVAFSHSEEDDGTTCLGLLEGEVVPFGIGVERRERLAVLQQRVVLIVAARGEELAVEL